MRSPRSLAVHASIMLLLSLLTLCSDAVRLIREEGYREGTHFYHDGGGYAYHFNSETATSVYFKCAVYEGMRCHGRAVLRVGGGFRHTKAHNHPPDPDFVGMRHFRQNILEQVMNARAVSYQEIVDEARRDRRYSRRVRSRMTLRRLRTPMYQARMRAYPPIPYTLQDLTRLLLHNPNISETVDGEDNMYAGSVTAADGSHHVAFISRRMLHYMGRLKCIQGDGTFRARPAVPPSCQCFVLVTTLKNCVIPLAWILMERRTLSAYRAVFRLLKQICPNLNPESIISDWEYSQQKAWEEAFPRARIQGCLWHLCRAIVKKAKKLNLLRYRQEIPGLLDVIRKLCAIALLPDAFFDVGLQILKDKVRNHDIVMAFLLWPLFQYFEEKWLNKANRRSWMSFYKSTIRTNNSCECHNRMLRKAVGAYRPNIFFFIEATARLEHNANLDIQLLSEGGNPRRSRRWQSVYTDRQLENLSEDLEEEIYHDLDETVYNFISTASHLFHSAFDAHVQREVGAGDV